jgi:hypothetical protein
MKDKLRWFVVPWDTYWSRWPAIPCEDEDHAVAVLSMIGSPYTFVNGVNPETRSFERWGMATEDGRPLEVKAARTTLNDRYLKYVGLL